MFDTKLKFVKYLAYFLFLGLIIGCKGEASEQGMEISSNEIDLYVEEKLSDSQEYDVSQSLRFSRENETYEVVRYMQNDSVILYLETDITANEQVVRQTFFKDGLPIYVDEYVASNTAELPFTQRKTYLDGVNVLKAYERSSQNESDMEFLEYQEIELASDAFDFERPTNAMLQKGDYEMKFEEFIVIDPQRYLILENEKSKYDVALFIAEAHPLLDQLFADPEGNIGRTIFVVHQFVLMNGIERTLFVDGYFTDEGPVEDETEENAS